jgi:hypothetical protein
LEQVEGHPALIAFPPPHRIEAWYLSSELEGLVGGSAARSGLEHADAGLSPPQPFRESGGGADLLRLAKPAKASTLLGVRLIIDGFCHAQTEITK